MAFLLPLVQLFRHDCRCTSRMYAVGLLVVCILSTFASDPSTTFIIVAPSLALGPHISAVGEHEAFYQVWCSGNDPEETWNLYPYVEDDFDIPAHSVCLVETHDKHLHLFLQDVYLNQAMSAPVLPVAHIGKKYVVPSYDVSIVNSVYITLAVGNWTASVDVTDTFGNSTRYDIAEYQIINTKSEASGMTVTSSREVAVFTESEYDGDLGRYMYTQLSSSEDFGNEYVLAVGSLTSKDFTQVDSFTEEYYINITCLFGDTTILFNDGVIVTIGEDKFYHKDLMVNGSLQFTSSEPVMVYLCLKAELVFGEETFLENPCIILPPVERYSDSAVINIPKTAELMIMTEQDNNDFHAFTVNNRLRNTTLLPSWKNIPNSDYKVGTAVAGTETVFMKSSSRFTVIVTGFNCCSIPKYEASLSISTSSESIRPITSSGIINKTSSMFPTNSENKITALVIGSVCGAILLLLGAIVVFHGIRRKRLSEANLMAETENSPTKQERRLSFEVKHISLEIHNHSYHNNLLEGGHTHAELPPEGQTVDEHNSLDRTPSEDSTSTMTPHAKPSLEVIYEGPTVNEYENK